MPQADEADVIQHIEQQEQEQVEEHEQPKGEPEPKPEPEPEADEVVVSIGEESPTPEAEPETDVFKELRKRYRDSQRQIKELQSKVSKYEAPAQPALGPEPSLEDCDYDESAFKAKLREWYDRKAAHEQGEARKRDAERQQQEAWNATLSSYGQAKAALKVKDFAEAEDAVSETLSVTQQGIILEGAKDPALVVYALGKHPEKAKALASITSPVKFAFAVAELEKELKVTPRKPVPPPERVVRASAPASGTVDSELERLRADADRTGDRTKVAAYMRQKQQAK